MVSYFILVLEILASLGFGAYALHFLRITKQLTPLERITWSFALGFGLLGWILFFVGVLWLITDFVLLDILILGASGTIILLPAKLKFHLHHGNKFSFNILDALIVLLLLTVLGADIIEALSPPADADTLAYHFNIPKNFYISGGIEFIPRALDGAVPLLVHMTYLPAYGLGGELALTMWTMVSGWGAAGLIYSFLRQWSNNKWALVITLVYMTTPAVVFGGGSGHIEVRLILFLLLASWSMTKLIFDKDWRYAVVAGLSLGFLIGSKYTGLVFATAVVATFLGFMALKQETKWFSTSSIFLLCIIVAGSQWYIWNWLHTGDPIFPVLYELLTLSGSDIWNTEHHTYLKSYLAPIITIVAIIYLLWFFFGGSQRVRFLLPAYALLMAASSLIALRLCSRYNKKYALGIFIGVVILVQIGGQIVATVNHARYVFTSEPRDKFLTRNLKDYPAVQWINGNLKSTDKVYTYARQLNYLFKIPIYYAHIVHEVLVDIRPTANNPKKFLDQLI